MQGGGCTDGRASRAWFRAGGFGSFSKNFGMAAAGLLEAEIVTADGKVRIVNACTEPDLFWALKGGGGGSFGVVTQLTLKTHELPPYLGALLATIQASSGRRLPSADRAFCRFLYRQPAQSALGRDRHLAPWKPARHSHVVSGPRPAAGGDCVEAFF